MNQLIKILNKIKNIFLLLLSVFNNILFSSDIISHISEGTNIMKKLSKVMDNSQAMIVQDQKNVMVGIKNNNFEVAYRSQDCGDGSTKYGFALNSNPQKKLAISDGSSPSNAGISPVSVVGKFMQQNVDGTNFVQGSLQSVGVNGDAESILQNITSLIIGEHHQSSSSKQNAQDLFFKMKSSNGDHVISIGDANKGINIEYKNNQLQIQKYDSLSYSIKGIQNIPISDDITNDSLSYFDTKNSIKEIPNTSSDDIKKSSYSSNRQSEDNDNPVILLDSVKQSSMGQEKPSFFNKNLSKFTNTFQTTKNSDDNTVTTILFFVIGGSIFALSVLIKPLYEILKKKGQQKNIKKKITQFKEYQKQQQKTLNDSADDESESELSTNDSSDNESNLSTDESSDDE